MHESVDRKHFGERSAVRLHDSESVVSDRAPAGTRQTCGLAEIVEHDLRGGKGRERLTGLVQESQDTVSDSVVAEGTST